MMASFCVENRDVACYLVTKHSWKGKYKRIFSIGTLCVTTYNPQTLEITNQWLYEDFISIRPSPKNLPDHRQDEFIIVFKNKGKRDNMRFSSDYMVDIISDCCMFYTRFADRSLQTTAISAYKHSWADRRVPVRLCVVPNGIQQIDERNIAVASYLFKDIRSLSKLHDCPGGFVLEIGEHRRRHIFASAQREEFLGEVRRVAADYMGIALSISREDLSLDNALLTRLGLCSRDDLLTSYVEFKVQKFSPRHNPCARRILCLSEECLIERDPATYHAICATPLKQIVCLVRLDKEPQQFVIEFADGRSRAYAAPERDLILASLLDGTRAGGNDQVFVTGHRFDRSLRLLPHNFLLDEDAESQCMRHITAPPPGLRRADLVRRFNANIPYNGLTYSVNQEGFFTENKGKVIVQCLEAVLTEKYGKEETNAVHRVEAQLQCARRLFASKSGFHAFTEVPGIREKLGEIVIRSLQWRNEAIDHAVVEALCALMRPMHNHFELRVEQLNKQSLMSSPQFVEHLLDLVVKHVERGTGALVIAAMLDLLTYAVCAPFSETTQGETFDSILKLVAGRGRSFYALFHSSCMTIVKGAGMVMRAIIEESDVETSKQMQLLSLSEGAFLTHMNLALLCTGTDLRVLTNRQLSGHLLSLWLADNQSANDLLIRCIPRGLLDFLDSSAQVPVRENDMLLQRNNLEAATNEQRQKNSMMEKVEGLKVTAEAQLERFVQHWDLEQKLNFTLPRRQEEKRDRGMVVLRRRRARIRPAVNWKLFAYEFARDHSKADLIWNERTRDEFRHAVENELRTLQNEKDQAGSSTQISWNHAEFQVVYASLADEIRIGDYYLRQLLLENDENATPIHNPTEFFNDAYHRFLLSSRSDMRCLCLKAMAVTYGRHHMSVGAVGDAKHFCSMLARSTLPAERDHILLLLSKLALNKANVRELLSAGIVSQLVDLAVLAHLHVQRATTQNQTNVIEASTSQTNEGSSQEWYYQDKKNQRLGPVSFEQMKELYASKAIFEKTLIWAAPMEQWTPLFNVSQFRWTICVHSTAEQQPQQSSAVYNFGELAVICLDILVQMCEFFPSRDEGGCMVRPMPSVKLQLTQPVLLKCVVQLLLTYDPPIVQRVATLLLHVMQDNPFLPSLYLTGVFFFILMYNGSNVLPIARFLHMSHKKQAFQSSLPKFADTHSVLAPLLPEAAIFYLEYNGPEKYAEVFLGEFDNPEIIWNNEMRRHLIERVAVHISDFTHRLTSNVKAMYNFCPVAEIDYAELENELFCHEYYLRHLCDRIRFPDWPIRDPVPFLRSCLAAWHGEIDRKPPAMSIETACQTLGIPVEGDKWMNPAFVRKAYFKLAPQYHPDKNPEPEAREMFQKISTAYELLSSDKARSTMPDSKRIVLCLQAQSIVYSRYLKELGEYKYAGYGQLIKTVDLEAKDVQLFQKGGGALLAAAIELANYTLMSSPLNAEQLRRENGLEALQLAFDRCVPMISLSSQIDDMPVQVCEHICNCLGTAARFEGCRQRIAEMPTVFGNISHLLQFSHLPRLAVAAASCVSSMAVDTLLQMQLFQCGILWQLVPHLFHFDYTLDEGGVSHSEDTNKQAFANRLARASLDALASLAGLRADCPENEGVLRSVRALLTPYASRLMKTSDNDVVLKTLNSNTCDPYLVWDNGTRAELLEFVERHRTSTENTSPLFGAEFQLSIYSKELVVGEVFVRIYNEQPNFQLHDPKSVCADFLDYIAKNVDQLCGGAKKRENGDLIDMEVDWSNKEGGGLPVEQRVGMCLTALSNVLLANPGVEVLLIGNFELIMRYMRCTTHEHLQIGALKVLSQAAANRQCVTDVCNIHVCSTLFTLLVLRPAALSTILNVLIALSANGQIVKEILDYGGLLFILCVLLVVRPGDEPTNRLLAADLLSRLQGDKLTGPRWTRFIVKYLPPIFADALRDSPNTAITMLDSTNENPELIWNDTTRDKVREIVLKHRDLLHNKQIVDPTVKWDSSVVSEDTWCAYSESITGELVVGGVFVRLFVNNPGWAVRHPKQFCSEIVEKVLEQLRRPTKDLDLVTKAFVELMRFHPNTADQLPAQGYLPQFCDAMRSRDPNASHSAIQILQQLAENQYCADALCRLNCIEGIKLSMQNQPNLVWECSHALRLLLTRQTGELASQLLTTGCVQFLLDTLASPMHGVAKAAAARAEIVDALKAASLDLKAGPEIAKILDASAIWVQYKSQRHDLFLPAARTQAITAGGSAAIAGYLTDGMFTPPSMSTQPPPLEHAHPPL